MDDLREKDLGGGSWQLLAWLFLALELPLVIGQDPRFSSAARLACIGTTSSQPAKGL
jgi:hypothetical protein